MSDCDKNTFNSPFGFDGFNLLRSAATLVFGLLMLASPAFSDSPAKAVLHAKIRVLESQHDARIGVLIRDSGSNWHWGYRENERFLMASTFKSVLCGAVLDRVDHATLSLKHRVAIRADDILAYAPVTRNHVDKTLSIGALCLATLDLSDNTAANLLIDQLGGPQQVTAFLRRSGDLVTRLDRKEPALNNFVPKDPRDTTSPAAMLSTWERMLLGDALAPRSRNQLTKWMGHGGVTAKLIRASTPADWQVADKSGGGQDFTRNLVAMITPPNQNPYFVAIYISDTPANWATRNAILAEISAAVVEIIQAH